MKVILTLFTCLFLLHVEAQDIFHKLIGNWETEAFGGELFSYWEADEQGAFLGQGIFIEDGDTTYREWLRLFPLGEKWILVASPHNAEPYVFELKKIIDNEVIFENDRFKNPKRIIYRFEKDGTFYRRTEGRNEYNSPVGTDYYMKKKGRSTAPKPNRESLPELATMLAPEILSTSSPEFATTISPDGKSLFFNRTNEDRTEIYLMQSDLIDGEWSEPFPAPFSNPAYRDIDPFFTPDGRYLFFSSNRPLKGETESGDYNIWVARNKEGTWGQLVVLGGQINTEKTEIFSSVTSDGHIYYSQMNGDERQIMRSALVDKKYQTGEVQKIPMDDIYISNPAISPDEEFLIFSTEGLNGFGKTDLYLTWRIENGMWTVPQNLGEQVNSTEVEFAPSISPDGKYLYFTSERPGMVKDFAEGKRRPGDLYRISLPPLLEKLKE